jgi:hypothetical protein
MRHAHGTAALTFAACLLPASLHAQASPSAGGRPGGTPAGAAVGTAAARARPAACQLEGVWELVSATQGAESRPMQGYRQMKIVSRGHYMWLGAEARRDTITLRTLADSLRAFQTPGGAGTYTLEGNTYTEHLALFVDPTMQGKPFPATCRTEGDRWYHTYPPPGTAQAASTGPRQPPTVEVWRRVR